MIIPKGSITHLARQGHVSLQVPDIAIGDHETEEIPDEWICIIKGTGQRLSAGKESGYYYLTRSGFEANKEKLKESFELAIAEGKFRNQDWNDFVQFAERHFVLAEKATKKYIQELKKKIEFLEKAKIWALKKNS